eukprot:COSAG01_NODE_31_length_35900_cov_44.332169_27_plen_312_part_00
MEYALHKLSEKLTNPQMQAILAVNSSQLVAFKTQAEALAIAKPSDVSRITKLDTLQQILALELEKMRSGDTRSQSFLTHTCFRALVVTSNNYTAAKTISALAKLYNVQNLGISDTLTPEVQICVSIAHDGGISRGISVPLSEFSVVITLCESFRVRSDPTLLQLASANRVRHVAITCSTESPHASNMDEVVAALRVLAEYKTSSMADLHLDNGVLSKVQCDVGLRRALSSVGVSKNATGYPAGSARLFVQPNLQPQVSAQSGSEAITALNQRLPQTTSLTDAQRATMERNRAAALLRRRQKQEERYAAVGT